MKLEIKLKSFDAYLVDDAAKKLVDLFHFLQEKKLLQF